MTKQTLHNLTETVQTNGLTMTTKNFKISLRSVTVRHITFEWKKAALKDVIIRKDQCGITTSALWKQNN